MRAVLATIIAGILLQGCASQLRPEGLRRDYYRVATPTDECTGANSIGEVGRAGGASSTSDSDARLRRTICELRARAYNTMIQSNRFANSGAWRDIPLIGGVAAIAGLIIYGERNEGNLNPGEVDVIEGIGLGAGALTALATYLNPENARTVLRQASLGYQCMATHGDLVLVAAGSVRDADRKSAYDGLRALLVTLEGHLANPEAFGSNRSAAEGIRDRARSALDLYRTQVTRLDSANTYLHSSAWAFGHNALRKADRSAVSVDDLISTLQAQSNSIAQFSQWQPGGTPASTDEARMQNQLAKTRSTLPTPESIAVETAQQTRALLDGLPNVDALVLGFDTCGSSALAGAQPPVPAIQTVEFE